MFRRPSLGELVGTTQAKRRITRRYHLRALDPQYAAQSMTHGGARPGSGPKPKPDAMVKRLYVLRQDQVDWLESLANKGASMSQVVRAALDCYIVATEQRARTGALGNG